MKFAISKQNILDYYNTIKNYTHRTPVLTSDYFTKEVGAKGMYFKCENVQKTGSFKIRGAINAISYNLKNEPELSKNGFITHSSGNHAAAMACAGKILGVNVSVVMPNNSHKAKIEAVKAYGASLHLSEPDLHSIDSITKRIQADNNLLLVHPYDDHLVIGGQATTAYELIDEVDDLDYIVCSVWGGGLLAGTLLSNYYFSKNKKIVKVIAAEPESAKNCYLSVNTGVLQPPFLFTPNAIADGLRTSVGVKNFEIIKQLLDDIILVKEDETIQTMYRIFERMKIVVEPTAAMALAAVKKDKQRFKDKNVAVILCGGNVDLRKLPF